MKIFKTDDPEIIAIYQDYKNLKFIIRQMMDKRMYLLENEIIKEYVVDYGLDPAFTLFSEDSYSSDAQITCIFANFDYYYNEYKRYKELLLKYFKCLDKSLIERKNFYSKCMLRFYLFDFKTMLDFKKLLKDMIKYNLKNIPQYSTYFRYIIKISDRTKHWRIFKKKYID